MTVRFRRLLMPFQELEIYCLGNEPFKLFE